MIILYDGMIITMDAEKHCYQKKAIVIDQNKIIGIEDQETIFEKYKANDVKWVDCKGKVIYPGFVNTHIHTAQSIVRGVAEDMGRAPSYTSSVPQGDDLTDSESYVFSMLGAMGALKFGSTIISDNYAHAAANAKAFDELGIRAIVSERVHDMIFYGLADGKYEKDDELGQELLDKNLELLETYRDPEGRIKACLGPHAPDTCSKELLIKIGEYAEKYHVPITTHLDQSRMEKARVLSEYGVSSAELMKSCGLLNDRLLAAHGVFLAEDEMELLREAGVHLVHIPEGNAKAGAIARIADMQEMGINVVIGTDNGAANMIENMRMALVSGRILKGCITKPAPIDILRMATGNGAKALMMADKIGSIEVGKYADLVIVDYDKPHMTPCTNAIGNLIHLGLGNDVDTVIVNGEIVVEKGIVLRVDEKEIMRDARRIAQLKWSKSNPDLDKKYMYIF